MAAGHQRFFMPGTRARARLQLRAAIGPHGDWLYVPEGGFFFGGITVNAEAGGSGFFLFLSAFGFLCSRLLLC